MAKKLSSEERHLRQKQKLIATPEENKIAYIPQENFKKKVCEAAVKAGYDCFLNSDSIIMFGYTDEAKINEVTTWLLSKFGKEETFTRGNKEEKIVRVQFSYGFSKAERKNALCQLERVEDKND